MTPARAAEVLRSITYRKSEHVKTALLMGADALELLSWQLMALASVEIVDGVWYCEWKMESCQYSLIASGGSPVEALRNARAEWEKERGNK